MPISESPSALRKPERHPGDVSLVRLTVEVPDHDAKLHRYIKWRDRPKSALHRFLYRLDHVQRWYVYLGHIAPTRITEIMPVRP
jgi:hypothetical protein